MSRGQVFINSLPPKTVYALINAVSQRIYFDDSEITTEFLINNFGFSEDDSANVDAALKDIELILVGIFNKGKSPSEAVPEGYESFVLNSFQKFTSTKKTDIIQKLSLKTRFGSGLHDISWRVDTISSRIVALVKFDSGSSTFTVELDATDIAQLQARLNTINNQLSQLTSASQ